VRQVVHKADWVNGPVAIPNATIQFTSSGIASVFRATTDINGRYSIHLVPGSYSVKLLNKSPIEARIVLAFSRPPEGAFVPVFTVHGQRDLRADFVYDLCPTCL